MDKRNIYEGASWFEVMHTTRRSQTALMTLEPGAVSSEELNAHPHSDQTLIVFQGEVHAQIGDETDILHPGDAIVVPAGMMHRFHNCGDIRAVTFSVYAPPEFLEDAKG